MTSPGQACEVCTDPDCFGPSGRHRLAADAAPNPDSDWLYNEASGVLYGPSDSPHLRVIVATEVDPKYGHPIADALNRTTAAGPDPNFRDRLVEALIDAHLIRWREVDVALECIAALMPAIAAEVNAQAQVAATQRTAAVRELAEHSVDGTVSAGAVLRALASPAPAPQPEEGQPDVMPEGWIDADWTNYS